MDASIERKFRSRYQTFYLLTLNHTDFQTFYPFTTINLDVQKSPEDNRKYQTPTTSNSFRLENLIQQIEKNKF